MSGLRQPPDVEIAEVWDQALSAPPDKSSKGGSGKHVAQIAVFPHDDWEELDIEGGKAKAGTAGAGATAPTPVKPSRWANKRRVALVAGLAGLLVLALVLGLALGFGLAPKQVHRKPRAITGSPIAPKAPAAGSTVSRVAANDAAQLAALMGVKAAIDKGGILKGTWTQSAGQGHRYCSWKYVVCDRGRRVVEGLNFTTDAYEAVLSGQLPSGTVLRGLPGLREIDIRLHTLTGPLPDDWSELTQLELVRLDQNNLKGTLPASWGGLHNLRVATFWDNKLTGPIPDSWADLRALEVLDLSYNKLSGPLPIDFANLASLQELLLDVNAFEGGLPEDWAGLANLKKVFLSENRLTGPIPEAWGGLGNLTDLWLEYNQLSGALPASLGRLSKLKTLSLNDNAFSGKIPASWSGLTSLSKLWLYNNKKLRGCVPASLETQLDGIGFRLQDYVLEDTGVTGFCKP